MILRGAEVQKWSVLKTTPSLTLISLMVLQLSDKDSSCLIYDLQACLYFEDFCPYDIGKPA